MSAPRSTPLRQFDTHLPNLLREMIEGHPSPGPLTRADNRTIPILRELAARAIELDDPQLHILMLRLSLYEVSASERVEAIARQRERVASPAPGAIVRCEGCGSSWTDADLRAERAANPRCVSCCPERRPLAIDQWRDRAIAAREENERLRVAMAIAEPFVELLHSLTGETRARRIVWTALQQIRAALSSSAPAQEKRS